MADNADVKPGDKVLFGHRAARVVAVNGDQIEVEYRDTNTGSTVRRWTRAALADWHTYQRALHDVAALSGERLLALERAG